jgi:hypothetical protein
MSKPLPSAYSKYISIGFSNGSFVLGQDGEYPASATLAADLTAGIGGWTIAMVYLGSQADDSFQELSGDVAEAAKRMLLDDNGFQSWADRHMRGMADSDRGERVRSFFNDLAENLARTHGYERA